MAIFHLSAKVISRGKGQSAIAAAAYRSGERLEDEQAGQQKYYPTRDQRIQFTDILAPKDAPEWARDRNQLWNNAERAEKRKDSQLAREIEVSLPHELTPQQRDWLVKDFAREAFVRKGYAVDIAIHAPEPGKDDRNHHAHLMVTMRTLGPEGFALKKDPSMNRREQLGEWRQEWAHLANRHLERHGHQERIDHRSLKEQGQDREPTIHLGYAAKEIEARGAQSDRMDTQTGIIERNGVRRDIKTIERELRGLEKTEGGAEQGAARAREAAAPAPAAPAPVPPQAPVVPLEQINVRHAAAEAERARTEALRQMARADKQDTRRAPTEAEQAFGDNIRQDAKEVRQERREARQAATQEAWRGNRDAEVARVTDAGTPKTPSPGLKVMDKATGIISGLGDFMAGLLAGSSPAPAREPDMKTLATDRAAEKEHRLARLAAREQSKNEEKALDRIHEDMKAGKSLSADDVRALTREHQEQIRMFGDDAMRQIVDDARKRSEKIWKGDERERER